MFRPQILKMKVESRGSIPERENARTSESKITVNITNYPVR